MRHSEMPFTRRARVARFHWRFGRRASAACSLASTLLTSEALSQCPDGRSPVGDLGIGLFQCVGADCLVPGRNSSTGSYSFLVEPRVWKLSSPAAPQLIDGDVLVAVDDMPITTPGAGARLARVQSGEQVAVRVRRREQELTVLLRAKGGCEHPSVQVTTSNGSPDVISRRVLERMAAVDRVPRPDGADGPMGFVLQTEAGGGPRSYPIVVAVRAGSDAERAGLRVGDLVVAVDEKSVSTSPARERLFSASRAPLRLRVLRDGRERTLVIARRTAKPAPQ